jgi:ABC-type sugar transport system ATPase subunit
VTPQSSNSSGPSEALAAGADPAEPVAFEMRSISKRFGPVQALADVTFRVRKGTIHALCGENGAGKSTLMKILAGVYRPDTGTIHIHGQEHRFQVPADALAAGVSMIYQELDLAQDLTVAENVFLGAEPAGLLPCTVSHRVMQEETARLAGEHGFTVSATARVSDLSTGDCQIVEVIKALRRNASIIVLDEPTSSLSENEATRLFAVVRGLRERGLAIVYISHRLEEVVDLADDISVLRDGKVVHSALASSLDIAGIVRHMVGRDLTDFFPSRKATIGDVRVQVDGLASPRGVRDIAFSIRRGEIVGMAGLVGAGRTEVARALFGVDAKTAGSLALDGAPVSINTPADAIRQGIAFLTEDRKRTGLCLELPCTWNITLPNLETLGMKHLIRPGRETDIAAQMVNRINIKWSGPGAPATSLSGGNQQKLLIARWLLANSRFLIFDEPTRGIDVGAKREVYALMNTLAEEGRAVLFISSELPELFGIADRILVMRRGRLVGDLRTSETSPDRVMHLAAVEQNS